MTRTIEGERVTAAGTPYGDPHPVSLISLANVLLRHRRLLATIPIVAVVAVIAYKMLQPPEYIADSLFMPRSGGSGGSRLAGLAAQFGVNVGAAAGDEQEGPEFYSALVLSRDVLRDAVTHRYVFTAASEDGKQYEGSLVDLYKPDGVTAEGRIRQVMAMLVKTVTATPDPVVGTVKVTVRAPWPELAEAINTHLLDLVNDFNLRRRQSQARGERELAEANLAEAKAALTTAEQSQQQFLQQNRQFEGSPQLAVEYRRLQRQVDFQQQLVTSLATSTAQAQLAEVRNTPVVTVIEHPVKSARRVPRNLMLAVVASFIFGVIVAAMMAFALDYLRAERTANPADFEEFESLKRSAMPRLAALGAGRVFRRSPRP